MHNITWDYKNPPPHERRQPGFGLSSDLRLDHGHVAPRAAAAADGARAARCAVGDQPALRFALLLGATALGLQCRSTVSGCRRDQRHRHVPRRHPERRQLRLALGSRGDRLRAHDFALQPASARRRWPAHLLRELRRKPVARRRRRSDRRSRRSSGTSLIPRSTATRTWSSSRRLARRLPKRRARRLPVGDAAPFERRRLRARESSIVGLRRAVRAGARRHGERQRAHRRPGDHSERRHGFGRQRRGARDLEPVHGSGSAQVQTTFYPPGFFETGQGLSGTARLFGDVEYRGQGLNKSSGSFYGFVDNATAESDDQRRDDRAPVRLAAVTSSKAARRLRPDREL